MDCVCNLVSSVCPICRDPIDAGTVRPLLDLVDKKTIDWKKFDSRFKNHQMIMTMTPPITAMNNNSLGPEGGLLRSLQVRSLDLKYTKGRAAYIWDRANRHKIMTERRLSAVYDRIAKFVNESSHKKKPGSVWILNINKPPAFETDPHLRSKDTVVLKKAYERVRRELVEPVHDLFKNSLFKIQLLPIIDDIETLTSPPSQDNTATEGKTKKKKYPNYLTMSITIPSIHN